MKQHEKINYVEFHSRDLSATKAFFTAAFGWSFTDYGPDYCDFSGEGLDGGFFFSETVLTADHGAPLIVFYSENLEASLQSVRASGGEISREIFDFPGGRRFHFLEPGGNELAVWTALDSTDA